MTQFVVNLLSQGGEVETYRWTADDEFFNKVQGPEIQHGNVDVSLASHRVDEDAYELHFHFQGEVELQCDRCMGMLRQPVEGECTLKVRVGQDNGDDGEQLTVSEDKGVLDLSWNVYEMIALQIPLRHVHADGTCDEEAQRALDRYLSGEEEAEKEETSDPRWDALKKILDNN